MMSAPLLIQNVEIPVLMERIRQLPRAEGDLVLLLVAEHTPINIQALSEAFRHDGIPMVGGIFPGIIYGDGKYESGIVADVVPALEAPSIIRGLDRDDFRLGRLPFIEEGEQYTALVLVDGLTKYVSFFLEQIFLHMGARVQYIGGGAGSLSFEQKPCLFTHEGIYQDAAIIVWLKTTMQLGIQHGWQRLRGPLIATETNGTTVQLLNRKPAFAVYRQMIEEETGIQLTQQNFFTVAKEYPLGIYHQEMDYIVRDPISFTADNALVCVGEVPERSLLYVLKGEKDNLVKGASLAAKEVTQDKPVSQHTFVVDCISRVLYLEDNFSEELRAVVDAFPQSAPKPFGVLSLGEIATFMTGQVEFFNKTIVIGALHDIL